MSASINNRIAIALTTLLVSTFVASGALAGQEDSPVDALNEQLNRLQAVEGEFSQVITDDFGDVVEENTGQLALMRPGYFRWHVDPPFEKLMVSDGETLWTYDPDLEQVTVEPVADKLLESPMLLLSGDPALIDKHYQVTRLSDEAAFALQPRGDNATFERMEIYFADNTLTRIQLHNTLGETQDYQFSSLTNNPDLDTQLFEFTPPPGADVLRYD